MRNSLKQYSEIAQSAQSKAHVNITTENVTPQANSSKKYQRGQLKSLFNKFISKNPCYRKKNTRKKRKLLE